MKAFAAIRQGFSGWIDNVACAVVRLRDGLISPLTIQITESGNEEFIIAANGKPIESDLGTDRIRIVGAQIEYPAVDALKSALAGNHIELRLRPDRFIFRPLELPHQATEFVHGIVRAQINRLTPWNPTDAAFGCSAPTELSSDRIAVTIAATPLSLVAPYVKAIADFGTHSIAVFTALPDTDAMPIKVWEEPTRGITEVSRARKILIILLATAAITAGAAVGADIIVRLNLKAQQDDISRQVAEARGVAGAAWSAARTMLERRKHDRLSTVMILETLSQILPDDTYVTELRVEDNKVRLTGITRDAPLLIGLIEHSDHFAKATFFAPTTRSSADPGERFHIEAVVRPVKPAL